MNRCLRQGWSTSNSRKKEEREEVEIITSDECLTRLDAFVVFPSIHEK